MTEKQPIKMEIISEHQTVEKNEVDEFGMTTSEKITTLSTRTTFNDMPLELIREYLGLDIKLDWSQLEFKHRDEPNRTDE